MITATDEGPALLFSWMIEITFLMRRQAEERFPKVNSERREIHLDACR